MIRDADGVPYRRLPVLLSNEGDPREPAHIHAERGDMEAKFWINPDVRVAYNDGFNAKALRELAGLVEANKGRIEEAWNGSFG